MLSNELTFANKEAAFTVAELLLEECYVVMVSREGGFYILNWEYSKNCNRNDVVFMSDDEFDEKYIERDVVTIMENERHSALNNAWEQGWRAATEQGDKSNVGAN